MEDFYRKLKEETGASPRWAVTVLEGEEAGKKWISPEKVEEYKGCRVFCERLGRRQRMVICGAGHVSIPVIQMGKMTGFHVIVLEDRPSFADQARRAGADEVICKPFREGIRQTGINEDTFVVIVTRGHRYDTDCLEEVLKGTFAYVGMMGSRRRTAIVKNQLEAQGYPGEKIGQIHAPIGLDIGAETPEEIAISIMAQIIAVRREQAYSEGYPTELLDALLRDDQKKMLATIISRKGSAPRKTGTKMLVGEDGTCVGTIGGGCAEHEIIQKALTSMRTGGNPFEILTVAMTTDEAEEEGMVCGGTIEVLLERV